MAKFVFDDWVYFYLNQLEFFSFDWDDGNSYKSLEKHGVECSNVESAFYDKDLLVLGIQNMPVVNESRYGILAKDNDENILFICFTFRSEKIRPISTRIANRNERELYEKSLQ